MHAVNWERNSTCLCLLPTEKRCLHKNPLMSWCLIDANLAHTPTTPPPPYPHTPTHPYIPTHSHPHTLVYAGRTSLKSRCFWTWVRRPGQLGLCCRTSKATLVQMTRWWRSWRPWLTAMTRCVCDAFSKVFCKFTAPATAVGNLKPWMSTPWYITRCVSPHSKCAFSKCVFPYLGQCKVLRVLECTLS